MNNLWEVFKRMVLWRSRDTTFTCLFLEGLELHHSQGQERCHLLAVIMIDWIRKKSEWKTTLVNPDTCPWKSFLPWKSQVSSRSMFCLYRLSNENRLRKMSSSAPVIISKLRFKNVMLQPQWTQNLHKKNTITWRLL